MQSTSTLEEQNALVYIFFSSSEQTDSLRFESAWNFTNIFRLSLHSSCWQVPLANVSWVILLRRRGLSWWQGSRRTSWKRCWTQRGSAEPLRPDDHCCFRFLVIFLLKKTPKTKQKWMTFYINIFLSRERGNVETEKHVSSPRSTSGNNRGSAAAAAWRALPLAFPYSDFCCCLLLLFKCILSPVPVFAGSKINRCSLY